MPVQWQAADKIVYSRTLAQARLIGSKLRDVLLDDAVSDEPISLLRRVGTALTWGASSA